MKMKWNYDILEIMCEQNTCSDDIFTSLHISKKTRYQYYQGACVHINHQCIKQNTQIQKGDTLLLRCLFEEDKEVVTPCFDDLCLLYEDELFLIVDKPANMLVHSDGVSKETTLYDVVKGYYVLHNILCPVRAIHRLDKETSGTVIFCKIPLLQPLLDHMLQEKQIERRYCAICSGILLGNHRQVCSPIGRDRHQSNKMRISNTGKEAKTDITIIKRYPHFTHVECKLHQGRTHQIRVHLSSIEHPILHDTLYGSPDTYISRLALHAQEVVLYHPLLQKQVSIRCPLPNDMKSLLSN
ncbi:RluA family pseudouridine synthase [Amedibacillus sp. YH-ame10]